jgi:hypothetical protein
MTMAAQLQLESRDSLDRSAAGTPTAFLARTCAGGSHTTAGSDCARGARQSHMTRPSNGGQIWRTNLRRSGQLGYS